jgi:hypothetical protein
VELSASPPDQCRSEASAAGQPPAVITHAWKAQQRLHARFNHLSYRKRPQIAVVAVAQDRHPRI